MYKEIVIGKLPKLVVGFESSPIYTSALVIGPIVV
jgi:hypothetical protein